MTPRLLGIVPALVAASSAIAQSTTSGSQITFALHWQDTGNQNGILEPGEGAVLGLDVSFTNQNTIAIFSPPVGTFGSGTIRGLGAALLDLTGSATNGGDAAGSWNVDQSQGYGVEGDWDMTGGMGNGTAQAAGAILRNIWAGQFSPEGHINPTNPIHDIWRGLWIPADYDPRIVTFSSSPNVALLPAAGAVVIRLTNINWVTAYVVPENLNFGSAQIPIVPAPPSLTLLASRLALCRRRRSETNR